MPRGEVIDLSLSTDDEKPVHRKDLGLKSVPSIGHELPHDSVRELPDITSKATSAVSKRRRLNQTSDSTLGGFAPVEKFYESRETSNPPVAANATVTKHTASVTLADRWNSEFLMLPPEDSAITASINARRIKSQCLLSDTSESSLPADISDDSLPEDIIHNSTHQPTKGICLSQRTSALLARLDKPKGHKEPPSRENNDGVVKTSHSRACSASLTNDETGSQVIQKSCTTKPPRRKPPMDENKIGRAEREKLRAEIRAQKAKDKEEELERKRVLKEEKAKQKQLDAALAEVNKSKLDKKITGPEMIVDLPASVYDQQIGIQIREFLKNLHIEVSLHQSSMPNMIKWRRKVKSRFNKTKGHWEVVEPMVIEDEKYAMCLMTAKEFVALASGSQESGLVDLETHVAKVKDQFEDCKPIYLIEGLSSWLRKNKTSLNRAYRAAVLNQPDENADCAHEVSRNSSSRRKKTVHENVDEDVIEDALLQLQVVHACLVHHTATAVESAEWVAIFTQQISMIPSRYFT